jgi:uncharacterized cysteine cluster protein YcgN (CxxCxxCC family)
MAFKKEESDAKTVDALTQSLCKRCGLCCDGTLFGFAKIRPDEDIVRLKMIGITTICDDGMRFALPCRSFDQNITHAEPKYAVDSYANC